MINFSLSVFPGDISGAYPFQEYDALTDQSFIWSTNISAGTSIALGIMDTLGNVTESPSVTVQSGSKFTLLSMLYFLLPKLQSTMTQTAYAVIHTKLLPRNIISVDDLFSIISIHHSEAAAIHAKRTYARNWANDHPHQYVIKALMR